MQHKYNMEAVDHTFRDLCESEMPFGGHTIVFGGDFQQILPVIIKGGRAQVVNACLQHSHLWGLLLCYIAIKICTLILMLKLRQALQNGSRM
jgi:PIF1-like helicase